MKNNKLTESWNKIEPDDSANERMLSAILEQNRSVQEGENTVSSKRTGKRSKRYRWGLVAAGLALIAVIGAGVFAVAEEAKEYNNAVAFFAENGLSTEGLSRSEMKAVYRDITENRFSYDKTAEVILQTVPGWDIQQIEPTPEELALIWDTNVRMNSASLIPQTGTSYRIDHKYTKNEKWGNITALEKGILECYRDGELVWTTEFNNLAVNSYTNTENGTVVWGRNDFFSSSDITYGWVASLDNEGHTVWQSRLDHGFKDETIASVLDNGDGTWAVISRGDFKFLCLSCFDADGNELSFNKTEVGNLGIWGTARLGDGYIVQLGNLTSGDTALIYKMDRNGNVTGSFSYEAEDCNYHITDLIEFEGQIYLSAYAVPGQAGDGGFNELANVLEYVLSKENLDISSEELTPVVRDNYTAVLLICDPDGGTPKTFYSVKGSLGGNLSVSASGQLKWGVESITATYLSLLSSSHTIGGSCKVFCYTFDAEGRLIGQEDTGEAVSFWK